ncbi:MAG TPA: hypothetical protein VGK71_01815 [Nitrospirota bacterium]
MKTARLVAVALLAIFCLSLAAGAAFADEKIKVKGKIKDYDIDKKVLVVAADDGKDMTFVIEDEKALKKLDDRLFKDDEVRIKYVVKDGKNVIEGTNDLKGTKPGC